MTSRSLTSIAQAMRRPPAAQPAHAFADLRIDRLEDRADRDRRPGAGAGRPPRGRPTRCSRSWRSRASPPNWHGVILCRQVRRDRRGRAREDAVVGRRGGSRTTSSMLLVASAASGSASRSAIRSRDDALAIDRPQPLGRHLADLRRVEAHPDLLASRAAPTRTGGTPRDSPAGSTCCRVTVQCTVISWPGDVLQDAVVGGRRPARVVLGLQAVDRDDDRAAAAGRATRAESRARRSSRAAT